MKTAQEIFTQVAAHLLTQGKRAVRDLTCRYRLENGCMCAIGCLIADEHYNPALETHTVSHASVYRALQLSGIDVVEHNMLLRELQLTHDKYEPFEWGARLNRVAHYHKLEMPCLT